MYKIELRLESNSFDGCRVFVSYVLFNTFRVWKVYYRSVNTSLLSTSGNRNFSFMGGLWRMKEEDVSETYDPGHLEGVVGVTFVVFDIADSEVEGILGADGDISEEESRIFERGCKRLSLR